MKEGLRAAALLAWLCALLCWVPSSEAAEAEAASSWFFSKKAPKNPCKDEPCHVHALCMPLKNCPLLSFLPCRHTRLCKCLPPFEGDGEIVCRMPNKYKLPKLQQCSEPSGPLPAHHPPTTCTHCWCMTRFWKFGNPSHGCDACYNQTHLNSIWQPDCKEPECADKPLPCKTWSTPNPLMVPPPPGLEDTLKLYMRPSTHDAGGVLSPFLAAPMDSNVVGTPGECLRCPDCLCYPVHTSTVADGLMTMSMFCPPPIKLQLKTVHGQTWEASFHACEDIRTSLMVFAEAKTGLAIGVQTLSMNGIELTDYSGSASKRTLASNGITHESVVWVQRTWAEDEVKQVKKECIDFVNTVAPSRMIIEVDKNVKKGEAKAVRVESHAMCPRYILDGHTSPQEDQYGGWGLRNDPVCAFNFCQDLGCCGRDATDARPYTRVNMRLPRNKVEGLEDWWTGGKGGIPNASVPMNSNVFNDARYGVYKDAKMETLAEPRGVCPERNEAPPKPCTAHTKLKPAGQYSRLFVRSHPQPKYLKADCECLNNDDDICFTGGETSKCPLPEDPPESLPKADSPVNADGSQVPKSDPCSLSNNPDPFYKGPDSTKPQPIPPKGCKKADLNPPSLAPPDHTMQKHSGKHFMESMPDGTKVHIDADYEDSEDLNNGMKDLVSDQDVCAQRCVEKGKDCKAWVFNMKTVPTMQQGACFLKGPKKGQVKEGQKGLVTGVRDEGESPYCNLVNQIADDDLSMVDYTLPVWPFKDMWASVNRDPWKRQKLVGSVDIEQAKKSQGRVFLGGYGE